MTELPVLEIWAEFLLARTGAPDNVQLHVSDLLASYLAGLHTDDGKALARLFREASGRAEIVSAISAIARQSECDDIELTSCVTPGAVVVPVALAHARESNSAGLAQAISRGYEAGILAGRALGGARALPNVWPTLMAAPLMAAVTVSFLQRQNKAQLVHAMALSLAGVSGRVGRPSGTPSGRWVAFASSVARGIRAAEAAGQGFKGDPHLCSPQWWEIQAGHSVITLFTGKDPPWPEMQGSEFKAFPVARQAATAIEAFQNLLNSGLDPNAIESVEVLVPRMNAGDAEPSRNIGERTSLLCNSGFQFACAAFAPDLLFDPDRKGATAELVEYSRRVTSPR